MTRRKIITPAFHFSILEDFVSIFDKHSSILVEKLRKYEDQGDFDIFPLTALCTLDIICGMWHIVDARQQVSKLVISLCLLINFDYFIS